MKQIVKLEVDAPSIQEATLMVWVWLVESPTFGGRAIRVYPDTVTLKDYVWCGRPTP